MKAIGRKIAKSKELKNIIVDLSLNTLKNILDPIFAYDKITKKYKRKVRDSRVLS
tara:strand:+ start:2385 stop:2549 length:165 start_codon:yes stop_codon:yes gene_type:complete